MTVKSGRTWLTIALVAGGCAGANPFSAARFSLGLIGSGAGGGTATQPAQEIKSTCDLAADRKVFDSFALVNSAKLAVRYSITFIASAGSGGFVCDQDVDLYQRAGYRAVPLDSQTRTTTIGCDPVPLQRGSQLLALQITGTIAANNGGPTDVVLATVPLNGAVRIPIPEIIVLGDNTAQFLCQGSDACTQGGFVYIDTGGNVTNKATAARTQGTVCNSRVGNLPEWRLFDPNSDDLKANAFQYTAGSRVIVQVLDRPNDNDINNNKVVWRVTTKDGNEIHAPTP